MFYDKRIHGKAADPKRLRRQFMLRGVRKINLWQHLRAPELGSNADDWKVIGDDIRAAMSRDKPQQPESAPRPKAQGKGKRRR